MMINYSFMCEILRVTHRIMKSQSLGEEIRDEGFRGDASELATVYESMLPIIVKKILKFIPKTCVMGAGFET